MLSSPAKRRKLSNVTAVDVNARNTSLTSQSKPTTPTRASYQSPTKASLARSHPHLAQQNQHRSLTEPSRRLKDNLLRARSTTATDASQLANSESEEIYKDPLSQETLTVGAGSQVMKTNAQPGIESRPPLQNRQPSAAFSSGRSNFTAPSIVPRLIKRFDGTTPAKQAQETDRQQPELPPTPVDLGWQEAPERPKGLSSSSPRGSKSGSGRQRSRLREHASVTSSPLKPKRGEMPTDEVQESEPDVPGAATASKDPEDMPDVLVEKSMTLKELKEQVSALKKSCAEFAAALDHNDSSIAILKSSNLHPPIKNSIKNKVSELLPHQKSISHQTQCSKHLTLFSPSDLQLKCHTTSKLIDNHPKTVQHLVITAPPPWPDSVFSASFDVVIDTGTSTIENIVWVDTLPGRSHSVGITDELFGWLDGCMKSKLHGCNVSNLVWGVGQYFERAVRRAIAWHNLSIGYKQRDRDEDDGTSDQPIEAGRTLTEEHIAILSVYLTRANLTIDLPQNGNDTGVRTRRLKKAEPKLMFTWSISLSWNGVAKDEISIVPSGIPDSAVQPVTELFDRLRAARGLEKAVDAVYEMVKGERAFNPAAANEADGSRQGNKAPGGIGKGKKRKRLPGF